MRDPDQARGLEVRGPVEALGEPRRADRQQVGGRTAGSATSPSQAPLPSRMPQVQSSPNGAAAPPVVIRTSISGACLRKSAKRGISQRDREGRPDPRRSGCDGRRARRPDRSGSPARRTVASARPDRPARRRDHQPVGTALEQDDADPRLEQPDQRLIAAALTLSSAAAAAKLPPRADASNALRPLRKGSLRIDQHQES